MVKKSKSKNVAAEQPGLECAGNARTTPTRGSGRNESRGAPPSNTAPANYTNPDNGTRVLRYGVDSLYLTYRGLLDEKVDARLDQLKHFASKRCP